MNHKRSLTVGGLGAIALCAAVAAPAQDSGSNVIGPAQLKDFSLQPRNRPIPEPQTQQPVVVAPPAPAQSMPGTAPNRAAPATAQPQPQAQRPAQERTVARPEQTQDAPATAPADVAQAPAPSPFVLDPEVAAEADDAAPAPGAPAAAEPGGSRTWLYALAAAALALLGFIAIRRRRRNAAAEAAPEPMPAPAAPPKPRPEPIPRPWLELALKAERALFTDTEAVVEFELEIANKGGSPARNLRIDVKMFNAGAEQDQEIGAFFKTAGRESTRLSLPLVDAGITGVIRGTVAMPRDAMRAMKLDERLLFIPVVAVNALYDWGEDRTGQTGKSYLVGREAQTPSEKMGAFRVDQGPRVWRTVGQRPHKLAKRV
jgi:hypothetical protein